MSRGFQQIHGIDYEETYAPVIKFTTLRLFFAVCAYFVLEVYQMDLITAFLNGVLKQIIFMEQPEGFVSKEYSNHVFKLLKSIYGLKQASREWHAAIDQFLMCEMKFINSPLDPCLYVRKDPNSIIIITLYFDDLLIACSGKYLLESIKMQLSSRFKMKDCGKANVCLGLEIHNKPSQNLLHINQKRYAEKILHRFGMFDSRPVVTPMECQISQSDTENEKMDTTLYRQAIGSLMYLDVDTRPDIAFAVSRLAQHVEKSTKQLWTYVKRVFRYISGTRSIGIKYSGNDLLLPIGFSDSDWGGCLTSRKSRSGFAFLMAGGAVSWKSSKQGCVAQSSSEAEYIALSTAVKEAIWMKNLFSFVLQQPLIDTVLLYVDNQGSIKMAKNDISGTRTKHIDIQYHFARDSLAKNLYRIEYIPTSEMVADIFTKPLQTQLFRRFRNRLGLLSMSTSEHTTEGEC